MKKLPFYFLLILFACNSNQQIKQKVELKTGIWKATLEVKDDKKLPFNFIVNDNGNIIIKNAEERIEVKEIKKVGAEIEIKLPIYDAKIVVKQTDENTLTGYYSKAPKNRQVPFVAKYGKSVRFENDDSKTYANISGKWKVTFGKNKEDQYNAIGVFEQIENLVTGTFLTETGDYRFLEGAIIYDNANKKNILKLSCFDGSHAFLFDANITNHRMFEGNFYSGNHYKDTWTAIRSNEFKLKDASKLTYLKPGFDKIDFNFLNLAGNNVSLSDDKYKNKAVVLQIMGSWCPNCLDESRFLSEFYKENKEVEIIALAFENAKTDNNALKNLERLKSTLGIEYEILLATSNLRNKAHAATKLPMLNKIISYPTLIFIDKNGEVEKIHTGFNGPATKNLYKDFKKDFKATIDKIK